MDRIRRSGPNRKETGNSSYPPALGWLLYRHPDLLAGLVRWRGVYLAAGLGSALVFPQLLMSEPLVGILGPGAPFANAHWVYLVHLPLVCVLKDPSRASPLPGPV